MVRWLERVVTAWLRSVAPSGWTDSVEGDLREDLAPRRPSSLRTLMAMAAIAMRFTLEAAWNLSRPRAHRGIFTDVRHATRALARTPAFSGVAVLTLALAIGANVAIYSALSSIVLRPLPFKDGNRFVFLWLSSPVEGGFMLTPRKAAGDHWRQLTQVFESVEQYKGRPMTLTGSSGEPEQIDVSFLNASTLPTFGVQPMLGRGIAEADTQSSATPVALISHALWQSRFGGTRDALGRTVRLDGIDHTIIGVMPPRFVLPLGGDAMWVAARPGVDDEDEYGRSTVAKLAPGVTPEAAQAALDANPVPRDESEDDEDDTWTGRVMTPAEYHGTSTRTALLVLTGAVGLLLLIACVNLANLMLSRHGGRAREIAVRHALGASRGRIMRYLLVETSVLSLAGGAAGLAVAYASLAGITAWRPERLDVLERVSLDGNVLMFAAAITLVTGLLFGLLPAISGSRADLSSAMKIGGRSATASKHAVRGLLTVGQIALALILLVGAGLLVRSYTKLMAVEPGFDTKSVLSVSVTLPSNRYPSERAEARREFFSSVLSSIEKLPGVTAASIGSMPASPMVMMADLSIEGRPDVQNRRQVLAGGVVTPAYFSSLGIPIREGRAFEARDADGPRVVIVNEAFAREFWPGESAIGKKLATSKGQEPRTVVGVAADVKFGGLHGSSTFGRLQLYFPRGQAFDGFGTFIVRTTGDPKALIPAVKTVVWSVDPELPLETIATAEELLARSVAERRFNLTLLAIFAGCGLVLAVVGVYGVTALFVGQRQREVGIRMALGATRAAVTRLVMRQALMVIATAVVAGSAGAWWLSRYLESMVYATKTTDPGTYAGAIIAVSAASLAATLVPLRRATSVDPAIVLRAE